MVLNGQALPIKSFQEYCELYLGDKLTGGPRECLRVNERWEICVAPTDGQFQQVCATSCGEKLWSRMQPGPQQASTCAELLLT